MRPCKFCGEEFEPTPSQIKRCDYACLTCRRAINRTTYLRRKALGIKTPSGVRNEKKIKERAEKRKHCPVAKQMAAELQRKYRKDPKKQQRFLSRSLARNALRSGKIKEDPCSICGATENLEMHHEDYYKPIDIIWMCRSCHKGYHRALKED